MNAQNTKRHCQHIMTMGKTEEFEINNSLLLEIRAGGETNIVRDTPAKLSCRSMRKNEREETKERTTNTHGRALCNFLRYLTASVSEEWYSRPIPTEPSDGLSDSCVEPAGDDLGGDDAGVRYSGAVVIISRKQSS